MVKKLIHDIDYQQLMLRYIDDDVLEGIILDYMYFSGKSTGEFILNLKSNFNCPPESSGNFNKVLLNISKKHGLKDHFEGKILSGKSEIVGEKSSEVSLLEKYGTEPLKLLSKCDFRILHISDIHMGLLHSSQGGIGTKPHNALIMALRNLKAEFKPHLCIISGDLTSVSADDEFNEAVSFLEELANEEVMGRMDGIPPKARILVVPGNHDNKWIGDELSTDKLKTFHSHVVEKGGFITPYGLPDTLKSPGRVCCYNNNADVVSKDIPPFSLIYYPEINICINLFTTCYYSGDAFKDKRYEELLKAHDLLLKHLSPQEAVSSLRKILELDIGYMSPEYLHSVNNTIAKAKAEIGDNKIWLAVTHHPVVPCGKSDACHEAKSLRTNLKEYWNTSLVLHGHAHSIDRRPDDPHPSRATGVGCPALSALDCETNLGILLHCIDFKQRELKSIMWDFEPEGNFPFSDEYLKVIKNVFSL